MGVANGADVHAEQLELGRHVGTEEWVARLPAEFGGGLARHPVAWRDQAEDAAVPGGAFADGVDVGVAAAAVLVDGDAAARSEFQSALAGEGVLRADSGGKHDQIGFQELALCEVHPVAMLLASADRLGSARQVHADAQCLDARPQRRAALVVQLHRHQARGELHDMSFQAEGLQRVGRFQAEQAAADHHAATRVAGGGTDAVQVVEGAVDQARIALGALDGRHERVGAGGQHQLVVGEAAVGGDHFAALAVDLQHRCAQVQGQARLLVERRVAHGQRLGIAAAEVFGQVHAVVGALAFLAEHVDAIALQGTHGDQLLDAVVADHAVADDD